MQRYAMFCDRWCDGPSSQKVSPWHSFAAVSASSIAVGLTVVSADVNLRTQNV